MKEYYIKAPPQAFQPIPRLKGNPLQKLHPDTIPKDYRKDKLEQMLHFLDDIEWHIKLLKGDFNNDYQNL